MASMTADGWENSFDEDNLDDIYVPEIDDTLLMKWLDESAAEEFDGDRVETVIRSLEDEMASGGLITAPDQAILHPGEDCEDCGLDDILCELDGHDCSRYAVDDCFNWMEMEAEAEVITYPGGYAGDWYVDQCMQGAAGCDDSKCYFSFYHGGGAVSTEQIYHSLWEWTVRWRSCGDAGGSTGVEWVIFFVSSVFFNPCRIFFFSCV